MRTEVEQVNNRMRHEHDSKIEGASTKQRKLCSVSNYLLGNHSDFVSVLPIQATSDGNCLFNSVSRLLYGIEGFATELRMRAVFDMIFNFDSYLCAANYPSEEIFHFCFSTTRDTKLKKENKIYA